MEKVILFNEESYLEFPSAHEAAKHLNTTQDKIVFSGKVNKNTQVENYYVEYEEDRIVQYHFRTPVKIWHTIEEASEVLLIHPVIIKNSLKHQISHIEKLHFKYFSETHGRPL